MAGGRQFGAFRVAELATVRRIGFGMADQAIRHLRQAAPARLVRSLQPAVARLALILRVEPGSQLGAGGGQVSLAIDRRGDDRRHIAQT